MVQSDAELTVAQRLGQLLDRGLLPAGGPAEAAERLIERLERPARIALLGLPGSGKSAILNLLTGTVVVPETLRLPTIIVQHGTEARMLCTLTDGRTQMVAGADLNDVLSLNPALVTLEMDIPALKVISLLEVSAGAMEAEQRRAAIWASKRADILIWCTTSYLPKEQQVWDGMPDVVKDNGFLFLTKVDLLGSREAAAGMLERVEMRAGEEFRQVLSISAKQARAAMPPGAPVDRDLFRDSGAAAVITTIKSRVQAARRADTDMAELLLARHVEAGGIVARRFAEPGETPPPGPVATPQWVPPPEASVEPEREADTAGHAAPVAEAVPEPVATTEPAEVAPDPVPDPEPETLPELEPEPAPVAEVDVAVVDPEPETGPAAGTVVEPDPVQAYAPEPEPMPEPVPEPVRGGTFAGKPPPETSPEPATAGERKRFSDRIKQMPMPDEVADAPQVPLRSTWKSKAETSAAAKPGAKPVTPEDARPAVSERANAWATPTERRTPRPDVSALRDDRKEAVSETEDEMLAEMVAAVASKQPEEPEELEEPEEPEEVAGSIEEGAEAPETGDEATEESTEAVEDAESEAETARWAERLMPSAPAEPGERTPRTSLFGSRKPAPAAPSTGTRPVERTARPTEPVMRVRAPAPRPPEAAKPAAPSPEELATPRFAPQRERGPDPASEEAGPQKSERRERPRIVARIGAGAAPVPAAPASVPSAEQEVLDAAIRQIVARATDLSESVNPDEKIPVDMILDHCRETTEQVIAILDVAKSAGLRRIVGDLGQIQDLVILMQLEKGHAPADDALTLLLQIRRDLETLRAA
jgi:hypothetical protein